MQKPLRKNLSVHSSCAEQFKKATLDSYKRFNGPDQHEQVSLLSNVTKRTFIVWNLFCQFNFLQIAEFTLPLNAALWSCFYLCIRESSLSPWWTASSLLTSACTDWRKCPKDSMRNCSARSGDITTYCPLTCSWTIRSWMRSCLRPSRSKGPSPGLATKGFPYYYNYL